MALQEHDLPVAVIGCLEDSPVKLFEDGLSIDGIILRDMISQVWESIKISLIHIFQMRWRKVQARLRQQLEIKEAFHKVDWVACPEALLAVAEMKFVTSAN